MKRNNIFNMERFLGLIGTGINRTKNISEFYTIAIFTFILIAWLFMQMITTFEFDIARKVTTRVYQVTYILFLSAPLFRLASNQERFMQWNLLPASAFEKYIFITLLSFIWRSIVFFFAMYAFDYMIWSDSVFAKSNGLNQCIITMDDFFMLGSYLKNMPSWLHYIFVFFFYTALPIFIGADNNKSFNRARPFFGGYISFMLFKSFLEEKGGAEESVAFLVVPVFAICIFITNIIQAIRRSRYAKA